ncbi:hypothetical protein [Solitalea canadensis]|uniref:Curli production assembly/transport component CsgG n=1 Tax=Solitalea canadensis (strain ATCC 29591 / DSM 3403 / JCM 21819 / LMG 8368 / NBRC 15130 / NCIMB 12057 / USAM 9D) TaxID=929556 RepID=H8KVY9_SOLCM|nr:hypothetical protein [Solitalea canadensis]AFD06892.1 hypothetical protein Solca_1831 [Solitalea canadensis DSM 3403]
MKSFILSTLILIITFNVVTAQEIKTGNDTSKATQSVPANPENKGKIAILPFHYIYDQKNDSEEMGYKVQNEAYDFLNGHTGELQIQDPINTNATLLKGGITPDNIRALTTTELCNMLGVEYLIMGTVGEDFTGVNNYTTKTNTTNNKKGNKNDQPVVDKNGVVLATPSTTTTRTTSTVTTSTEQYDTNFNLKIINDKGETVYNQNRTSMLKTADAYRSTLQYLLKRIPLYKK